MPSRREIIQLNDQEIREYLVSQKTIILVSNGVGGFPHPMPMWFYADEQGRICCTTFSKSQKVLNYQRDPRATLLVESGEEYAELKGLVIYADTEIVEDFDAVCDTLLKINTKGRDVTPEQAQKILAGVAPTAKKRVLLRFTPRKVVSWDHSKLGGVY
ncbi:MAG: pyridoxamine 5'-phosphate oxidase family protein [Pseudomonadales bacterium]|nr:pyridoxamine 5'-phosphate oxidase family protein [Pseudomonadales bacterium]MCP5184628.1 pyridoxamine 5'-phosphate oxidase family protein [Pseudomonadales bacterium]